MYAGAQGGVGYCSRGKLHPTKTVSDAMRGVACLVQLTKALQQAGIDRSRWKLVCDNIPIVRDSLRATQEVLAPHPGAVPAPLMPDVDEETESYRGPLWGRHGKPYPQHDDMTQEIGHRIALIASAVPKGDEMINNSLVLEARREGTARTRAVEVKRAAQSIATRASAKASSVSSAAALLGSPAEGPSAAATSTQEDFDQAAVEDVESATRQLDALTLAASRTALYAAQEESIKSARMVHERAMKSAEWTERAKKKLREHFFQQGYSELEIE